MRRRALLKDLGYSLHHPWVRTALWACLVGLLCAVLGAAFWWPAYQGHAELERQIAAKRREFVQAQQAEQLARAYVKAQQDVTLLEKKLEHAATQAQLVENLARLARQHGVRIISETYEEGRSGAGPVALHAGLAVQGSYRAVREFIRGVSTLPTWSEVHEVWLEKARESNWIKGRIRLVTYRHTVASPKTS